ncbi:flagellar protein FliL [Cytobacillus horneckiae]|uniref:Flagellar protein FliL n=1 Tax=Cytobacillus horneckiae TaxID=549687 RepID=A0A2N0ZM28_9BACI|nr:flagellar basal body-associated protein FliL [Cytobacillus horneckiae]NRG43423.1 flagellar basal body-associated protein FliL [Bacillus sp. CRN 9]MBN6887172.1 flagellar basal body-associated protein FliL [Cytobacillus horneckiae]MCM3178237.1 flagellar basal body-associated protein FliL [Cytobacillus horneckiae]MEC1157023.1 flagellar basal body-associated protein FliL [Cytobacillus horneckiae]MED2939951.1 flagellar basal body-associated protein FliL [Cytobacillus horneckiae]
MKKSKKMVIGIISIAIVIIAAAGVYFSGLLSNDASAEPTIDEVLESSVNIEQITANLASNDYIRISFTIQTDSKKSKEELEKRDFQVKNLIIQQLAEMDSEQLKGKDGQLNLQEELKTKINELMQTGKIEKVYITESILQ